MKLNKIFIIFVMFFIVLTTLISVSAISPIGSIFTLNGGIDGRSENVNIPIYTPYEESTISESRQFMIGREYEIADAHCSEYPDSSGDYTPSSPAYTQYCVTNDIYPGIAFQLFELPGEIPIVVRSEYPQNQLDIKLGERKCFDVKYGESYNWDIYYCSEIKETECVDSDSGLDYFDYGEVIVYGGDQNLWKDSCSGDILTERYCDQYETVATRTKDCTSLGDYICQYGECVTKSESCISNYEKGCFGGNVWYFDSCGNKEGTYATEYCDAILENCIEGSCVDKGTSTIPSGAVEFKVLYHSLDAGMYLADIEIKNNYDNKIIGLLSLELLDTSRQGVSDSENVKCGRPEDAQIRVLLEPGQTNIYDLFAYPLSDQEYVDVLFLPVPDCYSSLSSEVINEGFQFKMFDYDIWTQTGTANYPADKLVTVTDKTEISTECDDCPFIVINSYDDFVNNCWDTYEPGDSGCENDYDLYECQCFWEDQECRMVKNGCYDDTQYCTQIDGNSRNTAIYVTQDPPEFLTFLDTYHEATCTVEQDQQDIQTGYIEEGGWTGYYKSCYPGLIRNIWGICIQPKGPKDIDLVARIKDDNTWCFGDTCYPRKDYIELSELKLLSTILDEGLFQNIESSILQDGSTPICVIEFGNYQCKNDGECLQAKSSKFDSDNYLIYETLGPLITPWPVKTADFFNKYLLGWDSEKDYVERFGACVPEERNFIDNIKRWIEKNFGIDASSETMNYIIYGIGISLVIFLIYLIKPQR